MRAFQGQGQALGPGGPTLLTFVSPPKSSRRDRDPRRLGRRSNSKDAVQSVLVHPIPLGAASLWAARAAATSVLKRTAPLPSPHQGWQVPGAGHPTSRLNVNTEGTSLQNSSSWHQLATCPKPASSELMRTQRHTQSDRPPVLLTSDLEGQRG